MVQSQHGQLIHVNSVDMLTTCSLKEDGVTVSELFVNGLSSFMWLFDLVKCFAFPLGFDKGL